MAVNHRYFLTEYESYSKGGVALQCMFGVLHVFFHESTVTDFFGFII